MTPRVSMGLLAAQSDERLARLAREGHERAFEAVVQRYRRPLLRYCGRLGLSDSRAEDVLQHALLQAWLALEDGTEVRELRAWLYRIVHNAAVNAIRACSDDVALPREGGRGEVSKSAEADVDRRMALRDALNDVAALPQMQREAILLTAVDGRSHEEVASALGVTHGAVRGLLYRARATLRGAAAALTPQPLISWACGSLGRAVPTANRLAEMSAPGGSGEIGGVVFKGAALAATAAVVAAGAVVVPGLRHAHHASVAPLAVIASTVDPPGSEARAGVAPAVSTQVVLTERGAQRLSSASRGSGPSVLRPSASPPAARRAPRHSAVVHPQGNGGIKNAPAGVVPSSMHEGPSQGSPGVGAGQPAPETPVPPAAKEEPAPPPPVGKEEGTPPVGQEEPAQPGDDEGEGGDGKPGGEPKEPVPEPGKEKHDD